MSTNVFNKFVNSSGEVNLTLQLLVLEYSTWIFFGISDTVKAEFAYGKWALMNNLKS